MFQSCTINGELHTHPWFFKKKVSQWKDFLRKIMSNHLKVTLPNDNQLILVKLFNFTYLPAPPSDSLEIQTQINH